MEALSKPDIGPIAHRMSAIFLRHVSNKLIYGHIQHIFILFLSKLLIFYQFYILHSFIWPFSEYGINGIFNTTINGNDGNEFDPEPEDEASASHGYATTLDVVTPEQAIKLEMCID